MSQSAVTRAVNRLAAVKDSIPFTLKSCGKAGNSKDDERHQQWMLNSHSTHKAHRIRSTTQLPRQDTSPLDPQFFQPRPVPKSPTRPKLKIDTYGKIEELRSLLGLNDAVSSTSPSATAVPTSPSCCEVNNPTSTAGVTLVSIDTETEHQVGQTGSHRIVEIGITTLNTRDILHVSPGQDVSAWMALTKHHHLVIDITRKPRRRMHSSLFADSQFLTPGEARVVLGQILEDIGVGERHTRVEVSNEALDSPAAATTKRADEVVIVGQGVMADLIALSTGPGLRFELPDKNPASKQPPSPPPASKQQRQPLRKWQTYKQPSLRIKGIFDTLLLAYEAERQGARFRSFKLATLVKALGANAKYFAAGGLRGVHNASNDAAYAMMALLLFATRWHELVGVDGGATDSTVKQEMEYGNGSDAVTALVPVSIGDTASDVDVQRRSTQSNWSIWLGAMMRTMGW